MKCNRYVFSYISTPDQVRDYISRLADLAVQTYGSNLAWSYFQQMLDNARCLGWRIPRFSQHDLPEFFKDLTEEGVLHIFENQAKILIDISPISEVMLDNYNINYPVRMLGTSTAAGNLVWRCHLLTDPQSGRPYVWDGKQRWVKTRGTKVVCTVDNIPYEESALIDCMGGTKKGTWPVPFLPEFFSDHPLAQAFAVDGEVVELVNIDEPEPVHVLALNRVPWYRPLQMDRTKALPLTRPKLTEIASENQQPIYRPDVESQANDVLHSKQFKVEDTEQDVIADVEENLDEDIVDESELDADETAEEEIEPSVYTNVVVDLSDTEQKHLADLESRLANSGISSKKEAERFRSKYLPDSNEYKRAEDWLVTNFKRKTLLANSSGRMGALFSLIQRHSNQPIIILHNREKWASRLVDLMKTRQIKAVLFNPEKPNSIKKFEKGDANILVAYDFMPEILFDDCVVIALSPIADGWIEHLNSTHTVYGISIRQLGFADPNLIQEHPEFEIKFENYQGPHLSLVPPPTVQAPIAPVQETQPEIIEPTTESKTEVVVDQKPAEQPEQPANAEVKVEEDDKKSKKSKKKDFKVSTGRGRPVKAATLEDAKLIVEKKEAEGLKCQILDPENQVVYISKLGEI